MFFLTDGSDLKGINHPLNIKYIRYLRVVLICTGGWPGKLFGEKDRLRFRYQCFNVFIVFTGFLFEVYFVKKYFGILTFFDIGQTYITMLLFFNNTIRFFSLIVTKYDETIEEFINSVHLFHFRNESDNASKTYLFVHKVSHFFTCYYIGLCIFVAVFFNTTPLYNNITRGGFRIPPPANITYELSVYYNLPFDYEHQFKGYIGVMIYNIYVSLHCAVIICCYDLTLALLTFNLWGHLKIVVYNLEHFPRPGYMGHSVVNQSDMFYSDEEMLDVNKKLMNIVNQHRLILRHIKNISAACGVNIAVYYAFHQISGCLLLMQCSQLDMKSLVRFGPLTFALTQMMIQMSVIFELLNAMSDPLARATYNVPWECMDGKNRKLVMMMLRQTQIPLGLKALGMVEVGCRTMASILKTTLSYFLMLRTVTKNE